ncbi:Nucleoside permease NupC [Klebsiella grimontii]|nr:Nucleoside permease NupC [Klebsiella grimontii]
MQIIMGLIGMVVLLAIAVLLSSNRKAINLRTVLGAWIIQVGIGALILYVPAGRTALLTMSNGVANVIAYGNEGIGFIFGGLVSDKMFEVFGGGGFVFALRVLPVIVFFSSLIAVLYYLGIMQFVIRILGGALRAVLKTSRTESLSATANIFVGQTEAPLVVRPYIATMTRFRAFRGDVRRAGLGSGLRSGRLRSDGRTAGISDRRFVYGGAGRPAVREDYRAGDRAAPGQPGDGKK